jgi:phospholipid/cholesterol/gamma-HCH transport system permease protein
MTHLDPPRLTEPQDPGTGPIAGQGQGGQACVLSGSWNLRGLAQTDGALRQRLVHWGADPTLAWDLRPIQVLDSAGAFLLWQAWGRRLPARLQISPEHARILKAWQGQAPAILPERPATPLLVAVGDLALGFARHMEAFLALLGGLFITVGHCLRRPSLIPWREISATLHETGGRALGITALVGFLIGVVVSYLSSLQLKSFGAEIYIINILGLSIIRELGPLLAAILVAGRSGSAMTAQIGVMRVTQELDALSAMGISHSLRLILPKVLALSLALPLLIVWTNAIALIGGSLAARLELGLSLHQFYSKLPSAVPLANYTLGLSKGAVFGFFIALIACHYGLRIKPDTESLARETTNSVVTAITLVIIVDAIFAIVFRSVGVQ